MGFLLWIVLIFTALVLSFFLVPVTLRVRYTRQAENDRFQMDVGIWPGLLKYHLDMPSINLEGRLLAPIIEFKARLEGKSGNPFLKLKGDVNLSLERFYRVAGFWYDITLRLKPISRYLLRRIEPRQFKWQTGIGLSDAAKTGMVVGWLWSLKGAVLSYLYSFFAPTTQKPCFAVVPNFNRPDVAIFLDCIFAVKLGHIIIAGLRIGKILLFSGLVFKIKNNKLH